MKKCLQCDMELCQDVYTKSKRNFCSQPCRDAYVKEHKRRSNELCLVCRKLIPTERFCSDACSKAYKESPGSYCKLCDKTSRFKRATRQRRYLVQFSIGRNLAICEGLIMTCKNFNCINMSHARIASR